MTNGRGPDGLMKRFDESVLVSLPAWSQRAEDEDGDPGRRRVTHRAIRTTPVVM